MFALSDWEGTDCPRPYLENRTKGNIIGKCMRCVNWNAHCSDTDASANCKRFQCLTTLHAKLLHPLQVLPVCRRSLSDDFLSHDLKKFEIHCTYPYNKGSVLKIGKDTCFAILKYNVGLILQCSVLQLVLGLFRSAFINLKSQTINREP